MRELQKENLKLGEVGSWFQESCHFQKVLSEAASADIEGPMSYPEELTKIIKQLMATNFSMSSFGRRLHLGLL